MMIDNKPDDYYTGRVCGTPISPCLDDVQKGKIRIYDVPFEYRSFLCYIYAVHGAFRPNNEGDTYVRLRIVENYMLDDIAKTKDDQTRAKLIDTYLWHFGEKGNAWLTWRRVYHVGEQEEPEKSDFAIS